MKNQEIPKFLLERRTMLASVAFVILFSVIFMAVYSPFSDTAWFGFDSVRTASLTLGFYLVGIAVLVVSKQVMWWAQSKMLFTVWRYVLWLFGEFLLIALFYTFFTELFYDFNTPSIRQVLLRALFCVSSILVIPYVIATLYAAYRSKREELELLKLNNRQRDRGLAEPRLVNLCDNKGVLKLSIDSDSLYFMESQDNYVKVFYELDGKLHNYMLRCSTKSVEEMLTDTTMMRCHRSYIVNTSKIKLLRNDRSQTYVELDHPSIKPIPVSKSYYDSLTRSIAA